MGNKRIIFISLVVLAVTVIGFMYWFFGNSRVITIHFDQVSSAEILNQDNTVLAEVTDSGADVRVFTTTGLIIAHQGADGCASGNYALADDEAEVTLKPDFSEERKQQYFDQNINTINQLFRANFTGYDKYSVKSHDVVNRGEWIYILLGYDGDYGYSSDDLRTVVRLEDDKWKIVAEPNIVLTKYNSPGVDTAVLRRANALR